jgi:hypothetical protein
MKVPTVGVLILLLPQKGPTAEDEWDLALGMRRGDHMLKMASLILAAVVVVTAAHSAQACNENCRAIFTDPLSRKTTEGTDEICEFRREGCHQCAREKAASTGVTLACANCVIDTPSSPWCIWLCGGMAKVREVYFAAGCM